AMPDEGVEMKALSAARHLHRLAKYHAHSRQCHVEKRKDDAPAGLEHTPRIFQVEKELLLQEVRTNREEHHQIRDALAFGNLRSFYALELEIGAAAGSGRIIDELLID